MRTLIVAQTSNAHLVELNARSQAIRTQAGELGEREVASAARPYGLRAGDEVQVRRPVTHPELGRVSNGTTACVVDVDDVEGGRATLALAAGRQAILDRELLDAGQIWLAYVRHPFPAQCATVDTCHVVCAEHATSEGSYVALTRARAQTYVYAGQDRFDELDADGGRDAVVAAVAQRMGRTEPELPSIAVALAHEQRVAAEHARESRPTQPSRPSRPPRPPVGEEEPERPREARRARWAAPGARPAAGDRGQLPRRHRPRDPAPGGPGHVEAPGADEGAWRAGHWQDVYDQLGVLARRRVEGRQAREWADWFAVTADEQDQHADRPGVG